MRCFGRCPVRSCRSRFRPSSLLALSVAIGWMFVAKAPADAASAPRIWLESAGAALDCMSSRSLSLRMEGGNELSSLQLEIRVDPRLVEIVALDFDASRISLAQESGEALDLRALATAEAEGRTMPIRPDWIRIELRPRRDGAPLGAWPGRLLVLQLRGLAAGEVPLDLRVIEARSVAGELFRMQVDALPPARITCPGMTPVASLFGDENWASARATPASPASLPLTGVGGLAPGCFRYHWKAGDDFRALARAYRDDPSAMARRNGILNPQLLREGDRLRLCRLGEALR